MLKITSLGLPGGDIAKIIKIVHLFKEELLKKKVQGAHTNIMQYAWILKDLTDEEAAVFDEAVKRKSLFGNRKIKI